MTTELESQLSHTMLDNAHKIGFMPIWRRGQDVKFQVLKGNHWPTPQGKSLCLRRKYSTNYAFNNCFVFSRMCWVDVMNCFLSRKSLLQPFHSTCFSPFSSQSSVMSVCFARFHPNLVVGGTYSGQIVLWDNRSHRRTPVQRTPLSAAAHTVSRLCHFSSSHPSPESG